MVLLRDSARVLYLYKFIRLNSQGLGRTLTHYPRSCLITLQAEHVRVQAAI